jgi:hypothetical protein
MALVGHEAEEKAQRLTERKEKDCACVHSCVCLCLLIFLFV